MSAELRAEISAFLDGQPAMTVATAVRDIPWASSVFYARDDDFNLFFLSGGRSRH